MVKSDKDCLILFIIQTSEFEKNRGVLEKIQKLIVEYVNDIGLIVLRLEVTFWEETGMEVQHTIFNKETDSEKLARMERNSVKS